MIKFALLATLTAKTGKEKEVEDFLKSALPLVQDEPDTISWFAFKIGAGKFGIFDTFKEDSGRQAHLNGKVAQALMQKAPDLFASDPIIEQLEILAANENEVKQY